MRLALHALVLLAALAPAVAQAQPCVVKTDSSTVIQTVPETDHLARICDQLNKEVEARAKAIKAVAAGETPPIDHPMIRLDEYIRQFLYYISGPPSLPLSVFDGVLKQAESNWENARVDEQIGPTGLASGATNLVSRGSVPTVVGMAVEAGALTQTVSGSTATFRANAGGLYDVLLGRDSSDLLSEPASKFSLRRLSLAAAFDLNRPGDTTVPISESAAGPSGGSTPAPQAVTIPTSTRQLSSFVARYQVTAPRELGSTDFAKNWTRARDDNHELMNKMQDDLFNAVQPLLLGIEGSGDYRDWRGRFQTDLNKAKPEEVADISRKYLDELVGMANRLIPDFAQRVTVASNAYSRYFTGYNSVVSDLNDKPLVSLEYTYSRPIAQPDLHNIRFIYGWNPKGGQAMVSFNAAGTFYGSLIPNASKYGRARDVQAALQVDRPLPTSMAGSPPVLSIAAYYQYQVASAVLQAPTGTVIAGTNIELPKDAGVLLTPKGNMVIAQAKITIRMKDTGVKIPIGITWSNRTELIKANDVRGHIGLTYDFDSLLHR